MQYQVKGILTIVVLTALAGLATAKTIEERLVDCTGLDDQQRRLACFDELAIDVSSTSASGNVPGQGFGLEHKDIKKGLPDHERRQAHSGGSDQVVLTGTLAIKKRPRVSRASNNSNLGVMQHSECVTHPTI